MGRIMTFTHKIAAAASVGAMAAGLLAFAPSASADNYAPQLPSNRVQPGERQQLEITGGQPGCRVTYAVKSGWAGGTRGKPLAGPTRTGFDADGMGSSSLKMPTEPGRYRLITWVDNFPGQTGCTPTVSIQRIRVV